MGRKRTPVPVALAFGFGAFVQAQPASYDANNWKAVMETKTQLPGRNGPATVVLLQSQETTGYGGAGQPLRDVDLIITAADGKVLYSYVKAEPPANNTDRFYMDGDLRILDVTGDGVPEILFHSGTQGASDEISIEHILRYERLTESFKDITATGFYHSGRHGFAWLTVKRRTFAIVAAENWSSSVPIEERCHYCPSPFSYDTYSWSNQENDFLLLRYVLAKAPYSSSVEALAGDRTLIERALDELQQ
jgi:hypothetical protein